ncbi:unnamed protein product [Amoebophrya sp. A120]|nr:unnamed protein product [Amoebophrya sp. A120]|eukprot:GSA120T00022644001.1
MWVSAGRAGTPSCSSSSRRGIAGTAMQKSRASTSFTFRMNTVLLRSIANGSGTRGAKSSASPVTCASRSPTTSRGSTTLLTPFAPFGGVVKQAKTPFSSTRDSSWIIKRRKIVVAVTKTSTSSTRRCFSTTTTTGFDETIKAIGFIGLGNMGLPMCQNVVKATESSVGPGTTKVFALDKYPERVELAAAAGAHRASSVKQIAEECDVVFTMLFNTDTTEEVYRGAEGLFQHAKPACLLIDGTTIAPSFAKALGEEGKQRGFDMVDAPVSGGVAGATAGTLAFMCGASSEPAFSRAEKFLLASSMGKNVFYCGPSGTGSVAKVCNNMALAVQMISVSEALALGVKLGMDPTLLSNVMNKSSARCWAGDVGNPCPGVLPNAPASREYENGFKTSLMVKDLKLAIENADQAACKVHFAKNALAEYEAIVEKGSGDKDFGFVYQTIVKG